MITILTANASAAAAAAAVLAAEENKNRLAGHSYDPHTCGDIVGLLFFGSIFVLLFALVALAAYITIRTVDK